MMHKYIIETTRLKLRELNDDDFDNLKAIISDEETMAYYPKPYNDEGVIKWINWCKACYEKRGFGLWAVELKDGTFIGDCGISLQNIDGEDVFEIGYHFNKKYWKIGYAIEAARACKNFFFENTEYNEVYSYMNSNNHNSVNLAKKNGMKFIKEYELEGVMHSVYSISRNQYELERIYYVLDRVDNYYLLNTATFNFDDNEEVLSATNSILTYENDLIIGKYVKFIQESIEYKNESMIISGKHILLDNQINEEDRKEYNYQFDKSINAYKNNDENDINLWNNYLKAYENKFLNFKKI